MSACLKPRQRVISLHRVFASLLCLVGYLSTSQFAHAQRVVAARPITPAACAGGEVWEVSTRHLSCCLNMSTVGRPTLGYSRVSSGYWRRADAAAWQASLGALTERSAAAGYPPLVIFYVHGNWMTVQNARERVMTIDRALARQAKRPYQLVMLSWPSQRERGLVEDIRENGECADTQAHYLNYLLTQVHPAFDVSLLGFSFGGRSVTGALHLAAGGRINGISSQCGFACQAGTAARYRVTLIAPAVDNHWLSPGGPYELALGATTWMVNLYNSQDIALRRFRFMDRLNRPIAAGFRGFEAVANPRATGPLSSGVALEQFDCGGSVGRTHDEVSYLENCPYYQRGIDNLLHQFPAVR